MSPNHDYVFEIALDAEGNTQKLHVKKCTYSVFKAVRPLLQNNADKAIRVLITNLVVSEDQDVALRLLDSDELIPIQSMEDAFAQILSPVEATVKKSSTMQKSVTKKTTTTE